MIKKIFGCIVIFVFTTIIFFNMNNTEEETSSPPQANIESSNKMDTDKKEVNSKGYETNGTMSSNSKLSVNMNE